MIVELGSQPRQFIRSRPEVRAEMPPEDAGQQIDEAGEQVEAQPGAALLVVQALP